MPQINDIRELAQQNARYVSNSPQDWMSYLDVAARLYRYSFTDALLIHAQRPDATACAELELWNQKMNRWVNRGAKGIALLDDTGPRTKLRYVFDIADTHLVRGGRTPLLWNLDSHEHEQAILDHLADTYGLSQTDSMNAALLELAQQLTADNLDEAMDGLAYEVKDTFLEELDEDNIRVRFRELMTNSIFYTLSRRCGQEPMDVLDDDEFIRIVDFNKLSVLSFLGNAVSEQCEAVLFDIGREMRKIYKKEITQQLEKSVDSLYNTNIDFSTLKRETEEATTKGGQENGVDVLPQGRLSVPESGRAGRAADHREVRDAAQDVPEKESQELVSEYGYIRNPVTKRNEIDPEAAFYVQLIFQWELMGVPIFEIARRMTLLQVPTPREWHRKMVEGKEVLTCKKWGVTTIRHILENQTYVGDTINNKSTQKLFAGQDKRDLPKEQWYVAKNTHPAIIARDDFEKVQKILDKNRAVFHTVRAKSEQIRTEYQNDLAGMVFCADCGRPMEFERLPHGAEESKKVCYYICKARQADDKCIGHQITEKLLKALIMDQLHLFITQLSDRRKVVEELRKIEDVQNPVYRAKGEIMSLTDKVSQMAKKREQLYADYVAGVVDSEDYQLIREDYSRQYDGLRAALQEAENKKVQVEQQIEEYLNMTSHLEEHLDNFEFDIQLVKSLVQKIEVSADKRIRIVFGFRDVFTELGKESAET